MSEESKKKHDINETLLKWETERFREVDLKIVPKLPVADTFLRYITADGKPRGGGILQFVAPDRKWIRLRNPLNNFVWSVQLVKGTRFFTNAKYARSIETTKPDKEEEEEKPEPEPVKEPEKSKKKPPRELTEAEKKEREARLKKLDKYLHELFYDENRKWGAQKLYLYAREHAPDDVAVRQVDVREWIRFQRSMQLTKPTSHANSVHDVRPIVRPIAKAPLNIVGMDLKQMPNMSKKEYIMFVIDLYSRYLWAETLPSRDARFIDRAMDAIIDRMPEKPKTILTDNEFKGAFSERMREKGIKHITTQPHTPQSNAITERINNTWSRYYERIKIDNPSRAKFWFHFLKPFVEQYNETPHSAFNDEKSPEQMFKGDVDENAESHAHDVKRRTATKGMEEPDLEPGDLVRTPIKKKLIEKKSRRTYNDEMYVIDKVIQPNKAKSLPARAKLRRGSDGEKVQGEYKLGSLQLIKTGRFHKS